MAESRRPHPVEVYPHSGPTPAKCEGYCHLPVVLAAPTALTLSSPSDYFLVFFYYSLSAVTDTVIAKSPGDRADAEHFKRDFRRIVCLHEIRSVPEPQLMNGLYLKVRVIA